MATKPCLDDVHMSVRKMKEIFRKYDLDGDGVISQAQLEEILQKICPGLAKKEVDQMFRKIDKNNNGTLEYEEFVNLMFLDPTAKPIGKPPPACTVSSEAAYILFLLWEQTAGRQTRPGPVAKTPHGTRSQAGGSSAALQPSTPSHESTDIKPRRGA